MPANVETMFSVRETPWHGLGRIIMDAPASREALELAGLDWQVESRNIYSGTGAIIPGYRANVRSTDDAVLGVVSDRYRIVQNEEAFQFTDDLLGEGVTYETAGSLQGGKKVWMLARLPRKYLIAGDQVVPYLVIAKEEHFWKYNVMPEIPPVPTGSEGDTQQINQLYSVDARNKTADLNPIRDLLDKRQELSDQIEQLEQEKASIEQQVKLEMQDAAYGTAPGYKVSWVSSESKRVDSQRLKKEQPDIFNRYSKNVSSRRFTIIHAA